MYCFYLFGDWIVDECFIEVEHFVVYIEGNTRYMQSYCLYQGFELSKVKTSAYASTDLEQMLVKLIEEINLEKRYMKKKIRPRKHFIWDGTKKHVAERTIQPLNINEVDNKVINVSGGFHGFLGVMNRSIRKLRDLINNYREKNKGVEGLLYEIVIKCQRFYYRYVHGSLERMTWILAITS